MVLIVGCKKDSPEPPYPISLITGDWVSMAMLNKEDSDWSEIPEDVKQISRFRNDGLLLNEDNKAFCCITYQYIINGMEVKLDIKEDIPYVANCEAIYCSACEVLNMTVVDDTLIIEYCNGWQKKLLRV